MSESTWYLSFSDWLISLPRTPPRSIHGVVNGNISSSWLSNTPLYASHTQHSFPCSSMDKCLGCFRILAIVNSTAMNIGGHISFQTMFFSRCMPRSGIFGSYGNSFQYFREPPYHSSCGLCQFRVPWTRHVCWFLPYYKLYAEQWTIKKLFIPLGSLHSNCSKRRVCKLKSMITWISRALGNDSDWV